MISYVIVEDNDRHAKKIKDVIVSYMMSNKLEFIIKIFNDNTSDLKKYIKQSEYDTIYILDLELPSGDGLDIARYIRNTLNDWRSPIIICTSHTSLLFEVYKQRLQVLDFMAKCFDINTSLKDNLDLCLKMLNKYNTLKFAYRNTKYAIEYERINYIQRFGRKTMVVTKDKTYSCNIPVKELKNIVPIYFIISNKGTLLNMKNVEKLDWSELCAIFKDGTSDYVISKKHKKELDEYYNQNY